MLNRRNEECTKKKRLCNDSQIFHFNFFFRFVSAKEERKRFQWKAFLKLALFRLNLNSLRGIVQLTIDFSPPFSLYREMIWRVIESQSAYKRPDTFCPFRIKEKRQFCQPPNPNASESWL